MHALTAASDSIDYFNAEVRQGHLDAMHALRAILREFTTPEPPPHNAAKNEAAARDSTSSNSSHFHAVTQRLQVQLRAALALLRIKQAKDAPNPAAPSPARTSGSQSNAQSAHSELLAATHALSTLQATTPSNKARMQSGTVKDPSVERINALLASRFPTAASLLTPEASRRATSSIGASLLESAGTTLARNDQVAASTPFISAR